MSSAPGGPLEIERKYRLSDLPSWVEECRSEEIEQGYLALARDGTEVRLRRRGGRLLLTAKVGTGETRVEEEIELEGEQFDALWPLTEGRRIWKIRYLVPYEGLTLEVDVFKGDLEGMLIAEIEFDSEEASAEFEPPLWLGLDVTGDERYMNESLAVNGAPEAGT
jgi:CYTH domain-containing protein